MKGNVYVGPFAYALGDRSESVHDAAERELLVSPAMALAAGGFARHYFCAPETSAYDLARQAVAALDFRARDVDAIVYATCLPANGNMGHQAVFESSRDVRDLMQFPASYLQADTGIEGPVFGLDQQACTGLLGAIRLARSLVLSEPDISRVLCVTADRFPEGARYEQSYNLISDGAAACVVGDQPADFRLLACHHITNGALVRADDEQTLGSYFGQTCSTVRACLRKAGMSMGDVDWIVSQNTQRDAWRVLCSLLDVPFDKVVLDSLAEVGHVISADNVINLIRLMARGLPGRGQNLIMPMAGYGSNWQCIALQRSTS